FCGIQQAGAAEAENDVPEITVGELKTKMDNDEDINVLDVREPHEYELVNIGSKLIPLGELPERLIEVQNNGGDVAVLCRSGSRSADAVRLMQNAGFSNTYNVKGGILAWSDEIDPSIPKY
ncbi:MAG: molybdenum cofactor biosynthesis protein MoeB, partial [Rubrobacter sp.]|nr:molybdenum cofactor biosynthesis protein MoeB [Rubrobacter sp.]